jgi:hypothetical protein
MKNFSELKEACNQILDSNIKNLWCAVQEKSFFENVKSSLF